MCASNHLVERNLAQRLLVPVQLAMLRYLVNFRGGFERRSRRLRRMVLEDFELLNQSPSCCYRS